MFSRSAWSLLSVGTLALAATIPIKRRTRPGGRHPDAAEPRDPHAAGAVSRQQRRTAFLPYQLRAVRRRRGGGLPQDVKTFLDANPNEVLTLIFTNPEGQSPATVWKPAFDEAGISDLAFVPPSLPVKQSDWPTLGEMIDSGKRVVVFLDSGADGADAVDFIMPEFQMIWEAPFSSTDPTFPCKIDRIAGPLADIDHMYMINHNLNKNLLSVGSTDVLVSDPVDAPTTNGIQSILADANGCAPLAGNRAPNFVLIDYVNLGDPFTAANQLNGLTGAAPVPAGPTTTGDNIIAGAESAGTAVVAGAESAGVRLLARRGCGGCDQERGVEHWECAFGAFWTGVTTLQSDNSIHGVKAGPGKSREDGGGFISRQCQNQCHLIKAAVMIDLQCMHSRLAENVPYAFEIVTYPNRTRNKTSNDSCGSARAFLSLTFMSRFDSIPPEIAAAIFEHCLPVIPPLAPPAFTNFIAYSSSTSNSNLPPMAGDLPGYTTSPSDGKIAILDVTDMDVPQIIAVLRWCPNLVDLTCDSYRRADFHDPLRLSSCVLYARRHYHENLLVYLTAPRLQRLQITARPPSKLQPAPSISFSDVSGTAAQIQQLFRAANTIQDLQLFVISLKASLLQALCSADVLPRLRRLEVYDWTTVTGNDARLLLDMLAWRRKHAALESFGLELVITSSHCDVPPATIMAEFRALGEAGLHVRVTTRKQNSTSTNINVILDTSSRSLVVSHGQMYIHPSP
ncbi:hypothetical protein B0H13DRAFT_1879386 [Mycena leptocephala]|nr:hypothetical protein B0H13DRAFT_1879386 [Mycena leptocephala]